MKEKIKNTVNTFSRIQVSVRKKAHSKIREYVSQKRIEQVTYRITINKQSKAAKAVKNFHFRVIELVAPFTNQFNFKLHSFLTEAGNSQINLRNLKA